MIILDEILNEEEKIENEVKELIETVKASVEENVKSRSISSSEETAEDC